MDEVVKVAQTAQDPASGWHSLVGYLEQQGGVALPLLWSVDVQQDVDRIRRELLALIESEPPPDGLKAIYFGLFDAADAEGGEEVGYYVAGVRDFDPQNGETLCDPAWWPEGRHLSSAALKAVKVSGLSSAGGGSAKARAVLGYVGQLGAALLISRFASKGLLPGLRRVVGFDSGDFAEIAT